MKRIIFYSILLFSIAGFSQKAKSIQLDLGLTQTHEDFFRLYDGIVDLGGGYHIGITKNLFSGVSFHVNYLNRKNTKSRTFVYKPKIGLQYFIHLSQSFAIVPGLSGGYSFLQIKNNEFYYKDVQHGINLEPEIKLIWTRQTKVEFYFFGRFDFIYLNKDNDFTQLNYYRNVYLTSFGAGINIKTYGKQK